MYFNYDVQSNILIKEEIPFWGSLKCYYSFWLRASCEDESASAFNERDIELLDWRSGEKRRKKQPRKNAEYSWD